MLRESKRANSLPRRMMKAVRDGFQPWLYGNEWGAIKDVPPLAHVLDHWVLPYVSADKVALEIGPGGGRWTRHLLGFSQLYAVEYYPDLLAELRRNFGKFPNIKFINNNGSDFPGVDDGAIDFCFSFGVFVHLDFHIIEAYLDNLKRVMKPQGHVVLHYSDMNKIMARENDGFAHNTPEQMRKAVLERGYVILEEDTTSLWHSSLIRFAKAAG
jgi:SAM-dependent methyltransferase